MNRLQAELQRLYFPSAADAPDTGLRALLLELTGPGAWDSLAKAWQGVQSDLQMPAPGIAVSGSDGYQLWFSLANAVPLAEAVAFLKGVTHRYLADVQKERIRIRPSDPLGEQDVVVPPPTEREPGRWSAFVAPDLAALFAEEPWLDLAPSPDAQAELLARLHCATPAEWRHARELLRPAEQQALKPSSGTASGPAVRHQDPRRFLLEVMNDPAVELPLRIEAAKALLPYREGLGEP